LGSQGVQEFQGSKIAYWYGGLISNSPFARVETKSQLEDLGPIHQSFLVDQLLISLLLLGRF
jgi:hypothetical protein